MRFGVVDESDSDDLPTFSSDEDSPAPVRRRRQSSQDSASDWHHISGRRIPPRRSAGRSIQAYFDSSEEEDTALDSEDEVGEELGGFVEVLAIGEKANGQKEKTKQLDVASSSRLSRKEEVPATAWRDGNDRSRRPSTVRKRSTSVPFEDVTREQASEHDIWLRSTEEAAMLDGHRSANARRVELRDIRQTARTLIISAEQKRQAREEEEMSRMLQAMAIRQNREEAELAKRFADREKQLWADIDAAIQEVAKREAELRAAQLLAEQRKKEEDAARLAKEEKAAQERKADLERRAREAEAKLTQEKEAKAAQQKEEEDARAKAEEKDKVAAEKGKVGGEWRRWVDQQRWMKAEVIEKVKNGKGVKQGLRPGMRLITRGLGQVVNTREGILRVTNDLHSILCEQLPTPPSPSSPAVISPSTPTTYLYLLSHMSKALIKQAESEVSAKPDAAFPLARVVVGLLLRGHAALGTILFARFVKKCPWVIPFYPARQPDQDRGEYEKSTGRSTDESLTDYISRMSGIFTLHLSILQTPFQTLIPTLQPPPTQYQLPNLISEPLRITYAWTWISYALRNPIMGLPPMANLMASWIEVVGPEGRRLWGDKQVGKVMALIKRECGEGGGIKGDGEPARVGLELVVEGWEGRGYVKGREWE